MDDIREDYERGIYTQHGYILRVCERLGYEPLLVDRQALADILGMKKATLTGVLSHMAKKGLIDKSR
jgi:DNA-binding MarR family transcriptional regulator